MSKREKWLAGIIGLLVGLFALDAVLVKPLLAKLDDMDATIDRLDGELADAQLMVEVGPRYERQWRGYRAAGLDEAGDDVRLNVQENLSQWAGDTGLRVSQLNAGSEIKENGHYELRFTLAATGSLESVTQFLARLQSAPFPLKVMTHDTSQSPEDEDALNLRMTLSTIYLASEGADS